MTEAWHNLTAREAMKKFHTSIDGLDEREAKKRQEKYGLNVIPKEAPLSRFFIFLSQFKSPLIYLLLLAAAVSAAVGETIDSFVILGAVGMSVILGFVQEDKANRALRELKKMVLHKIKVLRGGRMHYLNSSDLVPGDVALIEMGDILPADGRLIEEKNLETNEASLTGESLPIKKEIRELPRETILAERKNMVWSGTTVTRGHGYFVVTTTGVKTYFGEVAKLVRETKEEATPFETRVARFSRYLAVLIIFTVLFVFLFGVFFGRRLPLEMFLTSIALAVAAIPEGLPIAVTVILALGIQRMARHRAIVRRMAAAETLGSVSVICTDKTGTLTLGEMRVVHLLTSIGDLLNIKKYLERRQNHTLEKALTVSLLCNNAKIENPHESLRKWVIHGDSTEKALLLKGHELGFDKKELEKKMPRLDEIPFDSERKFMATLHRQDANKRLICVKGAPEIIFERCSDVLAGKRAIKFKSELKSKFKSELESLAAAGLRVIALAYKEDEKINKLNNNIKDLVFVGLSAMKDPLREEARETMAITRASGIRPIIITGDHPLTASAIGKEVGLRTEAENVLEGKELDTLTEAELKEKVLEVDIYARVLPKHKLRIVDAWQSRGEVVAMTGDGINDAPAIKSADIGIALGSGAAATRETADMVLLDNNFKTIIRAIEGGRTIFENIKKVIVYLFFGNFSEVILVIGSLFLAMPLPITPLQILWVNLIADSLPAFALSFDKGEQELMTEKPRRRGAPILDRQMKAIIFFAGILTSLFLFSAFYFIWKITGNLAYSRTIAFVGLAAGSILVIYSFRSLRKSFWQTKFWDNHILNLSIIFGILLMMMVLYLPIFQKIFKTVPLGAGEWSFIFGLALFNIILIEFVKGIFIRQKRKQV